jgi:CBS domain containing-hemolysin-like protein
MLFVIPVLIVALIYLGYILSIFSSLAYVERERIEHVCEKLSGFKRKYLNDILDNPRISLQQAAVFKSLLLILLTILVLLISGELVYRFGWESKISYSIGLIVIWLIYLLAIEIIPRRRVLMLGELEIVRYLPLYIAVYIIFKPMVTLYERLFSGQNNKVIPEEQKEDIVERAIETLAEQAGITEPIVEDDEKEMIGQIFQLDVTEVREVMVPRVDIVGLEKDATLSDIREITRESGYSRYPVYEDGPDKIIGVLYIKDLFTAMANERADLELEKFIREPIFVHEKKKISDLLAEFRASKVHIAIVVDEYGGTAGLITMEDIIEEIVGEIQDEHDREEDPILHLPDNSLQVDASLAMEELLEELNLDYELEDFETVGGLIYDLVGSVPAIGTTIKWKDIIFEIEKVEGQRIISVKVWIKKGTEL